MCGISGLFLFRPDPTIHVQGTVAAMNGALSHRGPDDAGTYALPDGSGALGNRRLAIRDLSPAGHMPMSTDDGKLCITYNGEIYNAEELRAQLEAAGDTFHSQSDTEVILKGYARWGDALIPRLRGIFALAILDLRAGRHLFLARDPLGVKPLYYTWSPHLFAFASEIRALRAAQLTDGRTAPAALVAFLLLGSIPSPMTIHPNVASLPAATTLRVPLDEPRVEPLPHRYWHPPAQHDPTRTWQEAVQEVAAGVDEAVRRQMVSDAPIGAFLSGGLDSSAVVASMRRATSGTIRTCSIRFSDDRYDESHYARLVSAAEGTEHVERLVSSHDLDTHLDRILLSLDQPSVDGVNSYFVSHTAREAGLTVALSGLGGDELFAGYGNTFGSIDRLVSLLGRVRRVPGGRAVVTTAAAVTRTPRGPKLVDALARPVSPANAYVACRGLFSPSQVRRLVAPDVWQEAVPSDAALHRLLSYGCKLPPDDQFATDPLRWTSLAELNTYTHDQLLRDTDVMSMANSLEVRVPLLDHRLVERILRLPPTLRPYGRGDKPLLRAALGDRLPPQVSSRHGKQGFVFPLDSWMRRDLRLQIDARLRDLSTSPWLSASAVEAARYHFFAGRQHWSRLWSLVVLQSAL